MYISCLYLKVYLNISHITKVNVYLHLFYRLTIYHNGCIRVLLLYPLIKAYTLLFEKYELYIVKRHNQATIIKKSGILFWLLNITI